ALVAPNRRVQIGELQTQVSVSIGPRAADGVTSPLGVDGVDGDDPAIGRHPAAGIARVDGIEYVVSATQGPASTAPTHAEAKPHPDEVDVPVLDDAESLSRDRQRASDLAPRAITPRTLPRPPLAELRLDELDAGP